MRGAVERETKTKYHQRIIIAEESWPSAPARERTPSPRNPVGRQADFYKKVSYPYIIITYAVYFLLHTHTQPQ